MSFDPQIPDWGKEFTDNRQEKLFEYHSWLKNTGIKSGKLMKVNIKSVILFKKFL